MPLPAHTQDLQFRLDITRFEFHPMGNSPTPDVDYNRPDFVVLILNPPQLQFTIPYDAALLETGRPTPEQNMLIYRELQAALPNPAWIILRPDVTDSKSPSQVTLRFSYDCSAAEATPESIKLHAQAFYDALLALGVPYSVGEPVDLRVAKSRNQAQYDAIKDGTSRTAAKVNGFWSNDRILEIKEGMRKSEHEPDND